MCCFDGAPMTNATLVSASTVRCDAAPHNIGTSNSVSLSVTVDGKYCSGSSVQLLYRSDPVIYSISPTVGTESGGTVITVAGKGFGFGFESFIK